MSVRNVGLWIPFFLFFACRDNQSKQPRPRQYPRIEFPQKSYKPYSEKECPFVVDIPEYFEPLQKDYLFGDIPAGNCWFDLAIEEFNATIHCSYFPLSDEDQYISLVNDAFAMAGKHNIKATFREEFRVENSHGSHGLIFKIHGPVATPYQFYLSDSTNHFIRGSLYFDDQVHSDSIAPVVEFLREDIDVILASLQWQPEK